MRMAMGIGDIGQAKFDVVKKGYSQLQVDAFLDEVVTAWQEKDREIAKLQASIESYRTQEEKISKALVRAEEAASKITADAENQAQEILRQAQEQEQTLKQKLEDQEAAWRAQYEEDHKNLLAEIQTLRQFHESYRSQIQADLENLLARFHENDEAQKKWEEQPEVEEQVAQLAKQAEQEELSSDSNAKNIDFNDLLKDLPDSDQDLKAIIDELI